MARSPQLTRFLDYIVQRRLEGASQSIKAYSIAVDVLGRSADFDPQADPIVRVQARRLRALLGQYYSGPGAGETLRIELPVGRYVPEFIQLDGGALPVVGGHEEMPSPSGVAAPPPRGHVTVSWFVLLVIAIGMAALAYSLSTWGPRHELLSQSSGALQRPRLTVMEFQNLTGDPSTISAASGLAIEVVTDLEPFGTVNVRYGGAGESVESDGRSSDFVLTGIVRRHPVSPEILQYSVILTDLVSSGVVWNMSLSVPAAVAGRSLDEVSIDLVSVLGSIRGPLHAQARELLAQNTIAGQENAYLCRMLFDMYRDTGAFSASERANACYTALAERDRQTGAALAAVASLTAEVVGGGAGTLAAQMDRYRIAGNLMAGALQNAPTNGFVWEQRARLHELMGEHEHAEAAYGSALQLNPASMDALAARARHLALMGRLGDAEPLARIAIDGAPSPPGWYMAVPALAALGRTEFGPAAEYAESYSLADRELGPILAIMAAQGLGDVDMVNRYLPRVLEVPSFRSNGIITQLRRRITDQSLIERIRSALTDAGVPQLSLIRSF